MDRTLLATSLLEAARSRYAARVSFTFDAPLTRWGEVGSRGYTHTGLLHTRTGGKSQGTRMHRLLPWRAAHRVRCRYCSGTTPQPHNPTRVLRTLRLKAVRAC